MTSQVVNQVAFLRTSRDFPEEAIALSMEVDRTYVDIANAVNSRTIGLFPTNGSAVGGESWFLVNNKKQQNFRQVYAFTAAGNIPHGLKWSSISKFTKPTGSYTDGTNWYGAIYSGNTIAIAGLVTFYITPTNIVILSGAGSSTIQSGIIVLEWISNS